MSKLKGWVCPICLAGVSPDFDRCPCYREDKPKQQNETLARPFAFEPMQAHKPCPKKDCDLHAGHGGSCASFRQTQ